MTNCTSCGTEIPVKDIVAGKYKKSEGNTYCLACASKATEKTAAPAAKPAPAVKAAAASGERSASGVGSNPIATKTKSSASSSSITRPSGLRSAASTSSSSRSSSSSSSISRPGSGVRRPPIETDADVEEDEPRRAYQKREDPTTKIVGIVAGVLLLVAAIVAFVLFNKKSTEEHERQVSFERSRAAITEIERFLAEHSEDSSNDELEQLITKNAPFVIPEQKGAINVFKNQLTERREIAKKRKEFAGYYDFLKANSANADKAEEVKQVMEKGEKLLGVVGTPEQTKDFAAFKMQNSVAILEAQYNKATTVKEKNPDNYPDICNAFVIAEETMSDQTQQLMRSNVPGSARAKELFENVQGQANQYADLWASSDKLGFTAAPAKNLLDQKEFAKSADGGAHWVASQSADFRMDGAALVAKGLARAQAQQGDLRAGILFWGPNGQKMSQIPGSKDVVRNYEVTLKFKVVKKGFTLLARASTGYQRHAYSFETAQAQLETKEQNKKAAAQGRQQSAQGPAAQAAGGNGDPFAVFGDNNSPAAAQASESAFTVEEGKTYEVTERVYGKTIQLKVKTIGDTTEPEPMEDQLRARYGGIGFQLLPGAEVVFESISIKILN